MFNTNDWNKKNNNNMKNYERGYNQQNYGNNMKTIQPNK